MKYSEALKDGFSLVNRNLQLVAIQAALMLVNCVGFFLIVGIPLGIAFVIFGLDLTGLGELKNAINTLQNPADLLSRYFGLVLIVLISFLIYIIVVTTLWLFVFGGAAGIIGRSILEPFRKFTMRGFFIEARRLFAPLLWYSLLVGLVFIAAAFVLGSLSGGVAAIVSAAKGQDSTLALFLGIFFSLVLALIGLGVILGILATAVYGIAVIFFKGEGAARSFKGAAGYLWDHPDAFWLYVLLLCGYVLASFLLTLAVYPFNVIPFLGPVISLPFRILSYVVQGYLGLVLIGAVFTYYHSSCPEAETAGAEDKPGPAMPRCDDSSIGAEDISPSQVPLQEIPRPGTDRTEQS
ncbi:MAG: hypothetical protein P8013_09505 [Candidatus Sulfobium sp.]|jgi:hypothetical protein